MKNLIGKSINKKDMDKYLKYCNRYSLIINFIGLLISIPLVIYYRFYYDGLKYDIFTIIDSFKKVENFRTHSRTHSSVNLNNNLSGDNKEVKTARNLYILYFIGCLYIIGTIIDTYIRIYHKNNKYVKMWIGYSCIGDIISFFF